MRIIRDYIDEIINGVYIDGSVDIDKLDRRLVLQWINEQRALWIKNELSKGRSIEDNIRQTINGLKLIQVDASTFSDIKSGHVLLRTELKVPRTIEQAHNDTTLVVRNSNLLSEKYNYVHRDNFTFCGYGKFNTRYVFCTLYDGYLWIKLTKANPNLALLTTISVEGVFEDPREPYSFTEEYINNPTFDVMTKPYPISESMWTYIKGTIVDRELRTFITISANADQQRSQE